jgi:hypothetical protein
MEEITMEILIPFENSLELSRKIDLCKSFVRYAFNKLKEENDPTRNFDFVLQERFQGDIYDCITEFFSDLIYDGNEFSFEEYCNQHGGAFEDCLGFLQDFVDMHTDVEFFCLLNDYELPAEDPIEVPAE